MRKLIAVLALSIVITGAVYANPDPPNLPVVSIGEQLMGDVVVAQAPTVEHSYALAITAMAQSEINAPTALAEQGIFAARYHNGFDCNRQHGTNPSLLLENTIYDLNDGMISALFGTRLRSAATAEGYVSEVAEPSRWSAEVLLN